MGRGLGSIAVNIQNREKIQKIMVIIPARNEAKTIAEIVNRTLALGYEVVVVDDASSDGTAEAATEAGAEVLLLKRQRGNLGAIQAGLTWALEQGECQWLITLDGDGQHSPEDIPALLTAAQAKSAGLVIGSCPERSSWMRQMVWAYFRHLAGLPIRDMTSGFKVYTLEAARCLCSRRAARLGFQDVPALLLLTRHGFNIREAPVSMFPRRPGTGISRVFSSWGKVAVYISRVSWACLWHRPWVAGLKLINRLRMARPITPVLQKTPDEANPVPLESAQAPARKSV